MFNVWCCIQVQGDRKLSSQFCCIYSIRRVCADNTMHISHISLPQSNYRLSKLSITFWMYIGVCVTCISMKTHIEVGNCMNDRHRTRNDRCRCRHNCVNFFFFFWVLASWVRLDCAIYWHFGLQWRNHVPSIQQLLQFVTNFPDAQELKSFPQRIKMATW